MKKIVIILILFASIPAMAWDVGTYPREAEMQNIVYHWFMDVAILVDVSTDTPERIQFAKDIVAGRVNYNTLSVACATNASIRAKIIASDITYQNDLEYVIATEYESGGGIPLFTILAIKLYTATE